MAKRRQPRAFKPLKQFKPLQNQAFPKTNQAFPK
jgi:hypothetical protein